MKLTSIIAAAALMATSASAYHASLWSQDNYLTERAYVSCPPEINAPVP